MIVEREKFPFSVEAINELYGFSDKEDDYPGHQLINKITGGLARRMLEVIVWPSTDWEKDAHRETTIISSLIDN